MNVRTKLFALITLLAAAPAFSASLKADPDTFDFGWSPDNARISCQFTVKNMGNSAVDLQSLRPSCGCTAAQFSPMSLASAEDTQIGLVFNTRGYKGLPFSKSADLMTGSGSDNIVVHLKGHVADAGSPVMPVGTGIAAFEPGTKSSTQKITLQNKTDSDMKLTIFQTPSSWAKVKLGSEILKAKGETGVQISVNGSFSESRETSVTLDAVQGQQHHHVTLAIRTGAPEKEYVPLKPTNPVPRNGPSDPLKLKPIEPVPAKKSK